MNYEKVSSAVIKGFIGAAVAGILTIIFHSIIIPISGLAWALVAVTFGSFFSGFFAEYTQKIVCEGEENDRKDQFITLASVFFILGVTNPMENNIAAALYLIGSAFFGLAAYREWDDPLSS
ncbi:MAG: hypothetical protein ABEJ07_06545 [Candidatus Nanohaloarchaea archaeon]